MNENINLVEILKNAPKGTKLWSPLCGECTLEGIGSGRGASYPITCKAIYFVKARKAASLKTQEGGAK